MRALRRIGLAINGAGIGILFVAVFPQAIGVIVEDGPKLSLLGLFLIAVGAFAEGAAQIRAKREEGTRNA